MAGLPGLCVRMGALKGTDLSGQIVRMGVLKTAGDRLMDSDGSLEGISKMC